MSGFHLPRWAVLTLAVPLLLVLHLCDALRRRAYRNRYIR